MNEQVDFVTMSDREKYLYDLQGFLVVKDFLTEAEVKAANDALDANEDKRSDFGPPHQTAEGLKGEFSSRTYGDLLNWEKPWCDPFRNLIAHPKLIPYCNSMFGRGWRLDHGVSATSSVIGCEGLHLHGWGDAVLDGSRYYKFQNGRMRCALTVFQFPLTDVNPGDGGLVVVPGSHKANFPLPDYVRMYEADHEIFYNPPVKAGDMVIFNEATTHGTLPWKGEHERRALYYRYVPKFFNWIPAAYETSQPEWVSELTEAQQAVMEPPYVYGHPLINDDGESVERPRLDQRL